MSFDWSSVDIGALASNLATLATPEAIEDLAMEGRFAKYQDDPVGFCEDVLGETLTSDVKAMMESVRDNLITIAVSANATGKSHGAARVALWFYLCHMDTKVFTAAAPPLDNLKNILWGEIGSIVQHNKDIFAKHICTSLDIRRGPEDFLTGVTIPSSGSEEEREAKFSGKHQRHMLFVFDEGDAIPDSVYKGTESCMSGGHVRMLIIFNPRRSSGAVYRMIRDKNPNVNVVELSAFNHPNVISGENQIDGAVTRDVTVERINKWTRPLRDGDRVSVKSVFTLPDFLVGKTVVRKGEELYPPLVAGQYKIKESSFSYMVLGQYPAQGSDQLISEEWISTARARYDTYTAQFGEKPPAGSTGVMGLDVAEMGDDSNVVVGRYGGYLTQFDAWGGVDVIETGTRAVGWYRANAGITRCNVDGIGFGAGVAPYMQLSKGIVATGVKVSVSSTGTSDIGDFRILRNELAWRVREWLRTDSGAMLPPCEELIEELLCFTYDTDSGNVEVLKKSEVKKVLGRSSDYFDALAMTFAGKGGLFDQCTFVPFPPK
jgi:hypothetical protein